MNERVRVYKEREGILRGAWIVDRGTPWDRWACDSWQDACSYVMSEGGAA